MNSPRVVTLGAMFDRFDDTWHPRIVGEVNDSHVKVVKLQGEFVWHSHTHEDELFLVVSGRLRMQLRDGELEISILASERARRGAGSALIAACVRAATDANATRLWLITTNDNTAALRFYQRRGFILVALRPGAVEEARRTLKPEIGLLGVDDIPIRDEIELELPRDAWPSFVEKYEWPST